MSRSSSPTGKRQRMRLLATASLLGAIALSSFSAQAQDAALDQARRHLEARQPAAAFSLLDPLEAQRGGDPRFDYLLGIAALDAGHPTRAIFALERVLAVEPGNNLARAEIARAYIAAGETDTGRNELTAARRGPMPAEAAAAIDRVLSALAQPAAADAAGAGGVRGYAELALGWDGNVNSATAASQFAVPAFGGLLFTLAPGSREQEAAFAAVGAGVNLNRPLEGGRALIASVNGRSSFNSGSNANDFDLATLDASIGLSQSRGADTFTGALQATQHWVGGDSFRRAAGLSGQWQHNLSETQQLAGFAQWSRLSYPGQAVRNADRYVLGLGGAQLVGDGSRLLFGSAYLARENPRASNAPQVGHDATGLRAGLEIRAGQLTWFGQLQGEWRRYGGTEPFFGVGRRDDQFDASLGVHIVPAPRWRITPQISHTRNHSNIVLFSYDRTVVQVTARREF